MADVSIRVGADVSGAIPSLDRFVRKLRELGQTARDYQNLDLSLPGLQEASELADLTQDRYRQLLQQSRYRGLRERLEVTGQAERPWWEQDFARLYRDRAHGEFLRQQVQQQAVRGTAWEGQAPLAGGAGGEAGGTMAAMLGRGLPQMLSLLGIGYGVGALKGLADAAGQDAVALDHLARSFATLTPDFDAFRRQILSAGEGLSLTTRESIALAEAFQRNARPTTAEDVSEQARAAGGLARGFGVSPLRLADAAGRAQFAGIDARQLSRIVAEGVQAGGQWSRAGELTEALTRWAERYSQTTTAAAMPWQAEDYMRMLAAMAATGRPGLAGTAGIGLLGQVDESVRAGGGAGEASRLFLHEALARHRPLSVYQSALELEKGFFGQYQGRQIGELVMEQVRERYGDLPPEQMADVLHRLLGVGRSQALGLAEAQQSLGEGGWGKLTAMLDRAGINERDVAPSAWADLARLAATRPDDLDEARRLAAKGKVETPGSVHEATLTDVQRATMDVGDKLYAPLDALRSAVVPVMQALGKVLGVADVVSRPDSTAGMAGKLMLGPMAPPALIGQGIASWWRGRGEKDEAPQPEPAAAEPTVAEPREKAPAPPRTKATAEIPTITPDNERTGRSTTGSPAREAPQAHAAQPPPVPESLARGTPYRGTIEPAAVPDPALVSRAPPDLARRPAPTPATRAPRPPEQDPPDTPRGHRHRRRPEAPPALRALWQDLEARHDLPPGLLERVAKVESGFNPRAVSGAGAAGLFQLMPGTARHLGVTDRFDPAQSSRAAARYLDELRDQFGAWDKALAAYNWGPGRMDRAVERWGGAWREHLPEETRGYLDRLSAYTTAQQHRVDVAVTLQDPRGETLAAAVAPTLRIGRPTAAGLLR